MEELDVTWSKAAAIWWAFVWRSLALGFVAGLLLGIAAAMMGEDPQSGTFNLFIYLLMIPVGIWIMKDVLTNQFKGFRISLVPVHEASETGEATL